MKKLLSITLTLVLMLSLSVPAFAEIEVDGSTIGSPAVVEVNAQYVSANASGDQLEVIGNVTGLDGHDSINASDGAEIIVTGTVTNDIDGSDSSAVSASSGAKVSTGNVIAGNENHAIFATGDNTTVTAKGVKESGDIFAAIYAGDGATVTVNGDVKEDGAGDAINAEGGATVIVIGSVEGKDGGNAIYASGYYTNVKVVGDVIGNIKPEDSATVIVEGNVKNNINNFGGSVYVGQLTGNVDASDKLYYLIGFDKDSSAKLGEDFNLGDKYNIRDLRNSTFEAASGKEYFSTNGAVPAVLSSAYIGFNATDSSKNLAVEGVLPVGVSTKTENGQLIFTFDENFKGGMQNLVLVLTDKPGPTPGPDPDPAPIYYIVPVGSVTVVEITAPEGVEEGLIKALDSADHAGITVDSSLAGDGSVKVLKDGEELSANDFSIYTHADGSINVILSNTYLFALGSGSYDFTAIVNGLEIPFTVVVAK